MFLSQVNPFKMNSPAERKLRPAVFMHNLVVDCKCIVGA